VTKAKGFVEIGNDPARFKPNLPKSDPQAVRDAVAKAVAKHT
jgi:hypothetical protein